MVAVGRSGSAVLDAVSGERLDPPRSPPRAIGWSVGPAGDVATITTDGEVAAWDAAGRSLGRRALPATGAGGRPLAGMVMWGHHLDWTDVGLCASRLGQAVCVDPSDDWRTTLERTGTGTGAWGHLVACAPFAVDGVAIPGLRCAGRHPKPGRDRRYVEVQRDGRNEIAYLNVETLAVVDASPPRPELPEPRPSRGGGVRVVYPPGAVPVAPLPAPLPSAPTRDAVIPLTAHLGEAPPPWVGPGQSDPDALGVEMDRQEVRFRRADGSLGRLVVESPSLVARSAAHLAVRADDAVLLVPLGEGSVRSVHVGGARFVNAAVRGGGDGLVFSPDGSQLARVGPGVSRVWAVPGLDEIARGGAIARVGASPEGRYAIDRPRTGASSRPSCCRGASRPGCCSATMAAWRSRGTGAGTPLHELSPSQRRIVALAARISPPEMRPRPATPSPPPSTTPSSPRTTGCS